MQINDKEKLDTINMIISSYNVSQQSVRNSNILVWKSSWKIQSEIITISTFIQHLNMCHQMNSYQNEGKVTNE